MKNFAKPMLLHTVEEGTYLEELCHISQAENGALIRLVQQQFFKADLAIGTSSSSSTLQAYSRR